MAFADALYMDYPINHDLQAMKNLKITILMMTDNLSLFEFLTNASMNSKKMLMMN